MRKTELTVKVLLILTLAFILGTCDSLGPTGRLHEKYLFEEEYWGEWIRMDTGDTWYFASNYRQVNNYYSTSLDKDSTMERQSQNVIKITEGKGTSKKEYFLYASRIRNSTFEASAFQDDTSRGALSSRGIPHGAPLIYNNSKLGGKDAKTGTVGTDGKIIAEEIIAGDKYIVTIEGYEFEVTPNTDGENVGTLTLTNGVNIKTSIVPKSSSVDLMRLFSGKSYDLTVKFSNIGKEDCAAMTYKLELPPGIENTKNQNSQSINGIIRTIEPGKTETVDINIKCGAISEDFEFKKIAINTKDYYGKTWDDSVSLKVNKESITFNIRSDLAINGVVIVPNGKTYHFKTSKGSNDKVCSAAVSVPKYMKDYLVVFSGASASGEAIYSFAVDKIPAVNFADVTDMDILSKYWPNGTEAQAASIESDQEVMAYLMKNLANYYKVKFRN